MELSLKKANFKPLLIVLTVVSLMLGLFGTSALAVTEEQAMRNLTGYVQSKVSQEDYSLEEGGSIKGKDLFEGNPTKGYDLKEKEFNQLSSKAQKQLVSDIATYSNQAVEDDDAKGVEESTVQTWWKQLQTKEGVGSKFMTEILKNSKPDFVTANRIFEPFQGPLGVFLGILAVGLMSFLGIVMVSDIAYITLPPVRMFVSEDGNNGKKKISHIFSHDAILAVQISEESGSNSGGGESRQALGIYFKRRVVMLILLGICLLYLVQGQIYTLVGYILDLVSGFLGF